MSMGNTVNSNVNIKAFTCYTKLSVVGGHTNFGGRRIEAIDFSHKCPQKKKHRNLMHKNS